MKSRAIGARLGSLLLVAVLVPACSGTPKISNIGFVGTWGRSFGSEFHSQIAIVRVADGYRFRWKLDAGAGAHKVRCRWDGRCEEFMSGDKVGEYRFAVHEGEGGTLVVECTRTPVKEGQAGHRFTDVLELDPSGTSLTAYTVEFDGERFPREQASRKILAKVSDAVASPPRGALR